jgi:transcriptional antiterminator Rof (Rho-off)
MNGTIRGPTGRGNAAVGAVQTKPRPFNVFRPFKLMLDRCRDKRLVEAYWNNGEYGGMTAHDAGKAGRLIGKGANINAVDKYGRTMLMRAIDCDRYDVAELAIIHGAAVNAADKDGRTVLMHLVDNYRHYLAKALIDRGADANATDKEGKTALAHARNALAACKPTRLRPPQGPGCESGEPNPRHEALESMISFLESHGAK